MPKEEKNKLTGQESWRRFRNRGITVLIISALCFIGGRISNASSEALYGYKQEINNDGEYLYYDGHKIEDADPLTFEILSSKRDDNNIDKSGNIYYAKDKNKIFFLSIDTIRDPEVKGADRDNINILGNGKYLKDKEHVYYKNKLIENADPDSFKFITQTPDFREVKDDEYAKDKKHVYHKNKVIEYADPETFELLDGQVINYGIDKNNVYCKGLLLGNSDSNTFEILDSYSAKDKNNFYTNYYAGCSIISSIDPASYKILNSNYSKDINNVYFSSRRIKISGADSETFEVIQDIYGKDKSYVYYMDNIIQGADPNTFQYLNLGYAKDAQNAYFQKDRIAGVDLTSFKVMKDNYAADSFSTYYKNTLQATIPQFKEIKNNKLYGYLKGKIILRPESRGEAYYVHPNSGKIYFLSYPLTAFEVLKKQGIGILNRDLEKIPVAENYCPSYNFNCDKKSKYDFTSAEKQKGKIFLQVENRGEAWYVNPNDGKRYFLGKPRDALNIMIKLGLGIPENDFKSL